MKKVLIIAYSYLPMNNGGVQRIVNFRKYLPQYGWETHILTNNSQGQTDDERGIFRFTDRGYNLSHKSPFLISFLYKAMREILLSAGLIDEREFLWTREVAKEAEKKIDIQSYDLILASYPPQGDLKLGLYFHKKYHVPLAIDYRDGFMFEPFQYITRKPPWYINRMKNLEKEIAREAVLQVAVVETVSSYYKKYGTKTITVPNGFDNEENFSDECFDLPVGFNIVHTGSLGFSRELYNIKVIRELIFHISNEICDANFIFVGRYTRSERNALKRLTNVYFYNLMPRRKIIPLQRKADVLLLVSGNGATGTSGKLYEYLFSNRPILNIGGNNIAKKTIEEANAGMTFSPERVEDIIDYLIKVKRNEICFPRKNLEMFTRREQCRYFASELDQCLERGL